MKSHTDIFGYFSFEPFYRYLAGNIIKDGMTIVEVGAFMGKSSICLASLIQQQGLQVSLYVVDTWEGSREHKTRGSEFYLPELEDDPDYLYRSFLKNIQDCGVAECILPIRASSVEAAKLFAPHSLDIVFLDAAHDYVNLKQDILAWSPKLVSGGILGGDDYHPIWPGVMQACDELLGDRIKMDFLPAWYVKDDWQPVAFAHPTLTNSSLRLSLEGGILAALQDGELAQAEHLCAAALRNSREINDKRLQLCRFLIENNPSEIDDTGYISKEYHVTALVSLYKAERFIRGRLENLLEQSLGNHLEILALDSGSPEQEREVVREYQCQATNIRYIRTARRESIYQAWNRGVALASGRYLTNANVDDRLRYNALEQLVMPLEQYSDLGLCYADSLLTTVPNETFATTATHTCQSHPDYSPNGLLEWCITGSHPVWRRELHETNGLFDTAWRSAGDYDFFIRTSRRWKFLHVPQPLGLVWTSEETFSGRGHLPLLEFYAIRQRYRHWLQPTPMPHPPLNEQELVEYLVAQGTGFDSIDGLLERFGCYPQVQFAVAGMYGLAGDDGGEWRHVQRAFYLDPVNRTYQEALDRCLEKNLHGTVTIFMANDPELAQYDTCLALGEAAVMLEKINLARWCWLRCLHKQPDDGVSLAKLNNLKSR